MKLINTLKHVSSVGTLLAKALVSVAAVVLVWQGFFVFNMTALAAPSPLVAATTSNQAKGAADEVRDRSKDLIRDTKRNVEKAANSNANKVDRADERGGFFERKAERDRARIEKRAAEDAARTERAVDKSMDAVQNTVDRIKGAVKD